MTATKSSNIFITGCDSNTQWQLPWFIKNFREHNPNANLLVFDFGMNNTHIQEDIVPLNSQDKGWFKKPSAMMKASLAADKVCWLDTDCHVKENIENIFNFTEPEKLGMVEDVPWSKRRAETWHNSGVVVFEGTPFILSRWATEVSYRPIVGDQEVLHSIVGQSLDRIRYIKDLPKAFNVLRLDILDGTTPNKVKIMHWTGAKGNDKIREMMND
jgi:hypothetical protein